MTARDPVASPGAFDPGDVDVRRATGPDQVRAAFRVAVTGSDGDRAGPDP